MAELLNPIIQALDSLHEETDELANADIENWLTSKGMPHDRLQEVSDYLEAQTPFPPEVQAGIITGVCAIVAAVGGIEHLSLLIRERAGEL